MKKHVKKLNLSRETLLALGEKPLSQALGGTSPTVWSDCYCTNCSACCSDDCGTQLCL